jgi:hypothetical protein
MPFSMHPHKTRATGQYTAARGLSLHDRRAARRRFLMALGFYALLPPAVIFVLMLAFGIYPLSDGGKPFIGLSSIGALWRDGSGAPDTNAATPATPPAASSASPTESVAKPAAPPADSPAPSGATTGKDKGQQYDALRKAWR